MQERKPVPVKLRPFPTSDRGLHKLSEAVGKLLASEDNRAEVLKHIPSDFPTTQDGLLKLYSQWRERKRKTLVLVDSKRGVVGQAGFYDITPIPVAGGPTVWSTTFFIHLLDKGMHGQGIGRHVLDKLIQSAKKDARAAKILLRGSSSNPAMIKLMADRDFVHKNDYTYLGEKYGNYYWTDPADTEFKSKLMRFLSLRKIGRCLKIRDDACCCFRD